MTKPEDLTGDNKILFKAWTSLGMSEEAAMRSLRDSGWLPMSDHERSVEFYKSMGLSEAAAEVAARGRDGSPTSRPASGAGRWSAKPEPGDALSMVMRIEELATGVAGRGGSYKSAVHDAVWALFEAGPSEVWQDWIAGVAGRRWPWLYPNASSSTAATSKSGKVSETTVAEFVTTPRSSTLRRGRR